MRSSKIGKAAFLLGASTLMLALCAADAHAGWGHGSWGGSRGWGSSGGSWGSSGGSGGRWGSSGGSSGYHRHGGPVRNFFRRAHARHAQRGWGSSGGSWGSSGYSSSGNYRYYSASNGSSGSRVVGYGSSGYGSSGYRSPVMYSETPVMTTPGIYNAPGPIYDTPQVVPPAGESPSPGPARTGTEAQPDQAAGETAVLNLSLPTEAVVYVNGKRTRTEGAFRSYVSRNLKPGKRYSYEVRAEIEENGKTVARTKVIQMVAGANKTFEFDFQPDDQLITSVTLMVPEDAQVKMGGTETAASGPVRYFSTTTLQNGEKWENYKVLVTVVRDGKELTREKMINVAAGGSQTLRFDFDMDAKVASR